MCCKSNNEIVICLKDNKQSVLIKIVDILFDIFLKQKYMVREWVLKCYSQWTGDKAKNIYHILWSVQRIVNK